MREVYYPRIDEEYCSHIFLFEEERDHIGNKYRDILMRIFGSDMCRYRNFESLRQKKKLGVDFTIKTLDRGTPLLIAAPHGGGIEPGTSEIAVALAGKEYSFYVFEGMGNLGNHDLHIASTCFNEPRCLELIRNTSMVLTIHGCSGKHDAVYVGGLHERFKADILQAFDMAGFHAHIDISRHSGRDLRNICNSGLLGKGVQLEITVGLRRKMFIGLRREARRETTPIFERFVSVVRSSL